jgi:predicted dehydrogenase
MNRINWGIIGCGDVTEVKSGPAFQKVAQSALVAVMRRDSEKAKDFARRHQVPRWYDDAEKLIRDPEVNAIYVATPPSSHEAYAMAALNAGKPVYLEKPMAHRYAAASRIAHAAKEKRIKLVVAHYRRQQPRFRKIKQLIEEKAIGKILLARMELSKPPLTLADLKDEKKAWRVNPEISGGGLFHDLAPHQLDLMFHFFGPVNRAEGLATNQGGHYPAMDLVAGNILFENGVVFCGSWCFNAHSSAACDRCEVTGTEGKLIFSIFSELTVTLIRNGQVQTLSFDELPHVQQPMIEATVQYFLGNSDNPCPGSEAAEIMRLIEAFTQT